MLYHLFYSLRDQYSVFNVFRYITIRTAYAVLTALIISFILGPWLIKKLGKYQINQTIRDDGPPSHLLKAGTPTMGGLLILIALFIPTLLWARLDNPYIWLLLFTTASLGTVGFIDDYLKIVRKKSTGLKAKYKIGLQIIISLAVGLFLYFFPVDSFETRISIPFFKMVYINLHWFYIPFVMLVIIATSNAVNLTDGLDGLAIGPILIAAGTYALIAYVSGNVKFAEYLQIEYVSGSGELTVFCGAIIGAGLGFLWFNTYPASVFMGDIGSLALGGALAIIAIVSKHELLLLIIGGIFVIEALSVIIQVISYKFIGKRMFQMAPIHHHFELKGWAEPKIIVRFWIIEIILALLSLSTLKLR